METAAFVKTVTDDAQGEGPLCAILAGHIHSAQAQPVAAVSERVVQLVTEA
eukprot:COSAG02_NODE_57348_length_281_cov_0.571429_1_plen_50_part_01